MTFILALLAFVFPPTATCAPGWYIGTVHPDGVYACVRVPARSVCDSRGGCDDQRPDPKVWGRVWCRRPYNVDGHTVGCFDR